MELLLARMDENATKMDTTHNDMKPGSEYMKAGIEEMIFKFVSHREGTKSDPGRTEPSPGMMQSVGEHQEIPREEAEV
jgi:hypothetical protein